MAIINTFRVNRNNKYSRRNKKLQKEQGRDLGNCGEAYDRSNTHVLVVRNEFTTHLVTYEGGVEIDHVIKAHDNAEKEISIIKDAGYEVVEPALEEAIHEPTEEEKLEQAREHYFALLFALKKENSSN